MGKTELAKTLAAAPFDTEENMIRIDMSEYQERHTQAPAAVCVQAIPTLLVLRHGRVTAGRSGAFPAADLRAWVESAIGS